MNTDSVIAAAIEGLARQALGNSFQLTGLRPVAGGDINTALRAESGADALFVKLRPAQDIAMFRAEAEGLDALARSRSFRVPLALSVEAVGDHALLLLEWLDMSPLRNPAQGERAGAALADLHRMTGERYGWPNDNFIGSTPQPNAPADAWPRFFAEHRLRPQLALAARKGYRGVIQQRGEELCERLAALFLEYHPAPSLLHGDLWSGNIGVLADDTPVVFDPACYQGDREADLAMTELFGGFPLAFYSAYRDAWPLAPGYEARKTLYNLYHVLNHLNLFGRGYLAQAERMLNGLVAELKR